jgi:hypothetical protein
MSEVGSNQPTVHRLACLVIGRILGVAVIQSLFVRELIRRGLAQRCVIWTRPQVAFLFEDLRDCKVVASPFPVGTSKASCMNVTVCEGGAASYAYLQSISIQSVLQSVQPL